ncbi:MAG: DUF2752 domain-containing protein [Ruminiclostridium sp.]|nr:DUF2752 domain-containing protein [Ruminiclostridium sp.]
MCLLWGIYILVDFKCPINYVFYINCPTCGVTRALHAMIHGDWSGYLHIQPFALPLCVVVFSYIALKGLSKNMDRWIDIISLLVLVLNLGWCCYTNL